MRVIGIDPGTAITGYGILAEDDSGAIKVIDYGVIKTEAGLEQSLRLKTIYAELNQLILLHRPDHGAVEKLFFQKNVKTALTVGEARGIVLLAFANENVKTYEYPPVEVKQAVVGYGAAEKNQVQYMVKELLHLDAIPQPDDAADALAIALCHLHHTRLETLAAHYDQDNQPNQSSVK